MAEERRPPKKRRIDSAATITADQTTTTSESAARTEPDSAEPDKASLEQRRSLFVRSLTADTTSETLAAHFSDSFPIKHAIVVTDKATKKCKGYGFVTFTDAEDAQIACRELNGSELHGRRIKVEIAKARHRDDDDPFATNKPKADHVQKSDQQPPRLIVRNLPWTVKEPEQLSALFRSYGKVKVATVPKKGGKQIGFGIVVIRGRKNAEKAIAGMNGKEIDGRTIAVDWAVDKDTWAKMQTTNATIEQEKTESRDPDDNQEAEIDDEAMPDADGSDTSGLDAEISSAEAWEDHSDEMDSQPEEEEQILTSTVFIRNLPFTCTDEGLFNHFRQFGPLRYARVVLDPNTERSRGTGFVCFVTMEDCTNCVRGAPKPIQVLPAKTTKDAAGKGPSILQNDAIDPSGRYTLDGRVLSITQAVSKVDASRLTEEGQKFREARDRDKRRLYLLSEGTVAANSPLYQQLAPSEITMREASAKQRKMLIQSNPSLHISLTRLSIRNIPRSIDSKALKSLARDAIVGFATDVKEGRRKPLSKEELSRGGQDMKQAEHDRKAKGQGVVKQAKVVFETREGSKVKELEHTGRSRGYGFVEYHTHRSALMGLRWLNGYAVGKDGKQHKPATGASSEQQQDRKKRLIVEFAIENAQVVSRRKERESKAQASNEGVQAKRIDRNNSKDSTHGGQKTRPKRKRSTNDAQEVSEAADSGTADPSKADKLAKRNRIIAKKRAKRRAGKGGAGT